MARIIRSFFSAVTGSASTNECIITSMSSVRSLFASEVSSTGALESVSARFKALPGT